MDDKEILQEFINTRDKYVELEKYALKCFKKVNVTLKEEFLSAEQLKIFKNRLIRLKLGICVKLNFSMSFYVIMT